MTGQRVATRVLVVDDHVMFAELLGEVLRGHDDIVVTAYVATGDEALEVVARDAPDVVLLDYCLPGEDGIAVAARLREVSPDIGLIILTGVGDDSVLSVALLAGCTGFVTKDRATSELVAAVRAVRDGRSAIDPGAIARLATLRREPTRGDAGGLTQREREVLILLVEGATTREISERLFISLNTTRNHVQRLIGKLGAHSRLEAVAARAAVGCSRAPPGSRTRPRRPGAAPCPHWSAPHVAPRPARARHDGPVSTDRGRVRACAAVLGDAHVLTDPDVRSGYETDWTGRYSGTARCVARPGSTDEVVAVMTVCSGAGAAVVPQGGNTGLVGASVPRGGEVVVSMGRLRTVEAVDVDHGEVVAGAGATLGALRDAARADGLGRGRRPGVA